MISERDASIEAVSHGDIGKAECHAAAAASASVGAVVEIGMLAAVKAPNPYGRRGSPAHVAKVMESERRLAKRGYQTRSGGSDYERAIDIGNGRKRFPDLVMENERGERIAVQVGRRNMNGTPVAREQRALRDLRSVPGFKHVFFIGYP